MGFVEDGSHYCLLTPEPVKDERAVGAARLAEDDGLTREPGRCATQATLKKMAPQAFSPWRHCVSLRRARPAAARPHA